MIKRVKLIEGESNLMCSFCKKMATIYTKQEKNKHIYRWGYCDECYKRYYKKSNEEKNLILKNDEVIK